MFSDYYMQITRTKHSLSLIWGQVSIWNLFESLNCKPGVLFQSHIFAAWHNELDRQPDFPAEGLVRVTLSLLCHVKKKEHVMESEVGWRAADCALYSALPGFLPETRVIATALFQMAFTSSEIIMRSVCPYLGQKEHRAIGNFFVDLHGLFLCENGFDKVEHSGH